MRGWFVGLYVELIGLLGNENKLGELNESRLKPNASGKIEEVKDSLLKCMYDIVLLRIH